MARRKTIGKDPLGTDVRVTSNVPYEMAASVIGASAPQAQAKPFRDVIAVTARIRPAIPIGQNRYRPAVALNAKAHPALGGRIEIIGGDFGIGLRVIALFGDSGHVGFVAPSGDVIDLNQELDVVVAWRDRTEHRFLSAAGWGWALGTVAGPVGIILGAGVRLLHPRRMLLELRLGGHRVLVARTDHVTVKALEDLALHRGQGGDAFT
jgi:hypothetical protein